MPRRRTVLLLCLALTPPLGGCTALAVADAAGSATVAVGRTAVAGTVGAGRLAARGTGAILGLGRDED